VIAEWLGVHRTAVLRSRMRLIQLGFLTAERRPSGNEAALVRLVQLRAHEARLPGGHLFVHFKYIRSEGLRAAVTHASIAALAQGNQIEREGTQACIPARLISLQTGQDRKTVYKKVDALRGRTLRIAQPVAGKAHWFTIMTDREQNAAKASRARAAAQAEAKAQRDAQRAALVAKMATDAATHAEASVAGAAQAVGPAPIYTPPPAPPPRPTSGHVVSSADEAAANIELIKNMLRKRGPPSKL
jgi:hypothetical protein